MRRTIGLCSILMALFLVPGAWAADEAGWRLVSERNGIRVYRQDDDDARIRTFRGVTRFPIANPASLEALLNDYPAIPRWMHFISNGVELSRTDYLHRKLRFTTEVTYEIVMDPGGNIPAWAANIVLKDTPYFTLLKLQRIVVDPKYRGFRGTFFDYPWHADW